MIQIQMAPEQFDAKKAELAADYGVEIDANSGQVSHDGATVGYMYDGTVLTLTVIRKPFFISMATAEDELHAWFAGS
jgi:hypothetical protein